MSAGDLSAALWQERRQLELLLFRLETQRLHVVAGNLQWLRFTSSEVESVLDRLRFEALARSVESAALAAAWGLPAQAALIELLAAAPPGPWPEILQEHLDSIRGLLRQLRHAARANEEILRGLGTPENAETPSKGLSGTPAGTFTALNAAGVLDRLTAAGNIERALAVVRRTPQPLLAAYVGDEQD